jgi:hypothetical protein
MAVMSNASRKVTQAEIERAIRAVKAEGLRIVRVIARADGIAIETAASLAEPASLKPKPML